MHLLFQFSWRKRVDFGCNGAFQSQLFTSPNTQPIRSLYANNQYELLDLAEISMKDKFSFQNAPCCSIIYAVISQSSNIRRVFCFACCHSNHLLLCQRLGQMLASHNLHFTLDFVECFCQTLCLSYLMTHLLRQTSIAGNGRSHF